MPGIVAYYRTLSTYQSIDQSSLGVSNRSQNSLGVSDYKPADQVKEWTMKADPYIYISDPAGKMYLSAIVLWEHFAILCYIPFSLIYDLH